MTLLDLTIWRKRNILRFKLPARRRSTGRPRKRWRDNLPKDWRETRMWRKTGNMPIYSREKKKKKTLLERPDICHGAQQFTKTHFPNTVLWCFQSCNRCPLGTSLRNSSIVLRISSPSRIFTHMVAILKRFSRNLIVTYRFVKKPHSWVFSKNMQRDRLSYSPIWFCNTYNL